MVRGEGPGVRSGVAAALWPQDSGAEASWLSFQASLVHKLAANDKEVNILSQ